MKDCAHRSFDQWGIVVASRFLGRSSLVIALERFRAEGVWGVSPHLIPHYALHSPAGTLSLALELRGPNLGVGGGPGCGFEGFMTALSWLEAAAVPGLWLVQTGWVPEFVPNWHGEAQGDCQCQALALGLVPSGSSRGCLPGLRLFSSEATAVQPLELDELGQLLAGNNPGRWHDEAGGSPRLSAHRSHRGSGLLRPHFVAGNRARFRTRIIASDASGRLQVELVLPEPEQVREDR
jgi:hypothetical protein